MKIRKKLDLQSGEIRHRLSPLTHHTPRLPAGPLKTPQNILKPPPLFYSPSTDNEVDQINLSPKKEKELDVGKLIKMLFVVVICILRMIVVVVV